MPAFKPARKGETARIKANEWNAVREAAVKVLNGGNGAGSPLQGARPRHAVQVKNDQPRSVPAFGVLSVTGPVHVSESLYGQESQFLANGIHVKAGSPTASETEILCILQRAAQPAHFQPAVLFGPTPAWVFVHDTGHCYAKAVPDNVQMLESAETGPVRLMHNATKTGLQLLPVLLGVLEMPSDTQPLSGVVMEAIAPGKAGRVKLYGKNYPDTDKDGNDGEPVYDLIICDELAGAQNEFPEQLLPGVVLHDIRGPFRRKKAGSDEEGNNGNNNETESYYVTINTEGVYTGILASDVTGPDAESTIQVKDANGDVTTMTIHSYYIASVQTIHAGTGVMVARQQTDAGLRLVIIKSRYAVTLTEPPI